MRNLYTLNERREGALSSGMKGSTVVDKAAKHRSVISIVPDEAGTYGKLVLYSIQDWTAFCLAVQWIVVVVVY